MAPARELTDLQLMIMSILWRQPEATVADVHAAIRSAQRPSRQTVNTLLWRLERRGLVKRRLRTGQAHYRAAVSRGRVLAERLASLLGAVFGAPDVAPAALRAGDVQAGDVKRLRALLRQVEGDLSEPASGRRGR